MPRSSPDRNHAPKHACAKSAGELQDRHDAYNRPRRAASGADTCVDGTATRTIRIT